MARNNVTNITLTINATEANRILDDTKKNAERLQKEIDRLTKSGGDPVQVKKLQKELRQVQNTMKQLQTETAQTNDILRRLDRATPKELNKALNQLKRQLNNIERGSAAWDAQMQKIRAVKAELAAVNSQMQVTTSFKDRMINFFNKWQIAIAGVTASMAGLFLASRKAVSEFAEMDEAMANTRKFCGLTEEGVRDLNEEFKKMDTRTPREKLNELAQEAGRLGKQTKEDIMGYVKAADILNVALSDLGEGATQKIAKLSNIFGVEDELGTYDAMLKIGSVINVLSQNCTASKPYLVEFTNRLAGVGAQANMTIQEIVGLGAVLDANAQKVEASATAVSQVLTRMFVDSSKYAKAAGLDAKNFAELLKTDANEALLQFLEALNKAGNMDVLAPMFKDMGESGARAVAAMSTLAKHIDEVRWQQKNANQAFEEGTSVLNEYNIFNNTAQATIDKAKKRVQELTVELGEKLMPVMAMVHSSSRYTLEALRLIVDFVIKYHDVLIGLIAVIATYTVTINAANIRLRAHYALIVANEAITKVWRATLLLGNAALALFTGNTTRAAAAMRLFNTVIKLNPLGLLLSVITAVISALVIFKNRMDKNAEAAKNAAKRMDDFKKSISDISSLIDREAGKELNTLDRLYKAATDTTRATHERWEAAQKLINQYPEYFKNMDIELIMLGKAQSAYESLRNSILDSARAKAISAKMEENAGTRLELELEQEGLSGKIRNQRALVSGAVLNYKSYSRIYNNKYGNRRVDQVMRLSKEYIDMIRAKNDLEKQQGILDELIALQDENAQKINEIDKVQDQYADKASDVLGSEEETGSFSPEISSNSGKGKSDILAAEKEWRKKMEALALIAYRLGESDYLQYQEELYRIGQEYKDKALAHTELAETERYEIIAKALEEEAEMNKKWAANNLKEVQTRNNEELAFLKQAYADGLITKESYDIKVEEAEINHQKRLLLLFEEGSEERAKIEDRLTDLLIKQAERRRKELEDLESKYKKIKDDYFGLNAEEKKSAYNEEISALDIVYQREMDAAGDDNAEKLRIEEAYQAARLAIAQKYDQDISSGMMDSYKNAIMKSVEWLQSEGGQALTGTLNTVVNSMSAVFSQLTSYMQADIEVQTAAIEKRYDAEISRAQGSARQVARLEKQKEKEIAAVKNDANKKMFAMQVIQAIAQTATGAINAYTSAAAVPVVGHILAPIAAASAIAAGMIQVAAIKKQQQASEAQGYAEGGYTRPGGKYEVAGVVHAGEWVASQKLLNNPVTAPVIGMLDRAQRSNSIASLASSGSTPLSLSPDADANYQDMIISFNIQLNAMAAVIERLNKRLDEPFVTVNTVTGEFGYKQAEDKYKRYIRNKKS